MKKILRREAKQPLNPELGPPLIQRLLANRDIKSKDEVDYSLKNLLPPSSLKGISEATDLLYDALNKQSKILIIGDYDTDGATSSALAISALKTFGFENLNYLIPNRFTFGYGLTSELVEHAKQQFDPELIITVDNGIASIDSVKKARELGIDVLITDHHLAGDTLPEANAIVNPNQPGDGFVSKNLAGVGVIFYVMLALRSKLREINWFKKHEQNEPNMAQFLDLVALGTVADVVPLDYNNRILVHHGLKQIKSPNSNLGINTLIKIAKRNLKLLTASDLGFAIAPRLNAAGRLDDMSLGVACLLSDDSTKAYELAEQLNSLNKERRELESKMKEEAFEYLKNIQLASEQSLPAGVCLFDPKWHQGVIGILASRVKDKINRPVIAFSQHQDSELKGSARSVSCVHIRDVLSNIATRNPNLITKFGGHSQAAGLSLPLSSYPKFTQEFASEVAKHLDMEDLHSKIYTDGELNQTEFSLNCAKMLLEAGPFGQGFPAPVFDGTFNIVEQRLLTGKHLKLTLSPPKSRLYLDAIAFNVDLRKWPNLRCKKIFIAYRLDINEYLDRQRLQLMVEHLQEI